MRKQVQFVIEQIYSMFEPLLDHPDPDNPRTYIHASEAYGKLGGVCSRPSMITARNFLGIRTGKVAGRNVWYLPSKTPDEALDKLNTNRVKSLLEELDSEKTQHPSAVVLADVMKSYHYDAPAKSVVKDYVSNGGCGGRRIAFRIKKVMGIKSLRAEDKSWRWVWASPEVREWLEERLKTGPVPPALLYKEAASKGWTERVVNHARIETAGIKIGWLDRKVHWYDINTWSPL